MKMKNHSSTVFVFLTAVLFTPLFAEAQAVIIPQIADGGAWQTTLVLTNTSAAAQSVNMTCNEEIGGERPHPWNLQFLEVSGTQNLSVPAAGTMILHTQ